MSKYSSSKPPGGPYRFIYAHMVVFPPESLRLRASRPGLPPNPPGSGKNEPPGLGRRAAHADRRWAAPGTRCTHRRPVPACPGAGPEPPRPDRPLRDEGATPWVGGIGKPGRFC